MKFTGALSTLLILLPIAVQAAPGAMQARNNGFGFQKGGFGGFGGKGGNQNQNKGGSTAGNAGKGGNNNNAGAGAGAAKNGTAAAGGNNNNNNAGNAANAGNGGNNIQTSLTLDPSVICTNCAQTGQGANGTEAGQVASATSTNNFINFCAGKTITNGLQVQTGSCNPIPQGNIPAKTNQPAAKFSFPTNFGNVAANTAFTIKMNIQNLQTGAFVNPQTNYFAAPQDLNGQGIIIGHSHVTVQQLNSITDTQPKDPQVFAFFQGLNAAAQGGVLTSDVAKGLDAGAYRLCSINTDANHTPVLGPVAQHGSFDDCVYFTVGAAAQQQALKDIGAAGAANNNANAGAAANNSTANAGAAAGAAAGAGAAAAGAKNGGAAANNGAKTGAQGGAKTGAQSGANNAAAGGAKTGAQGGAKTGAQSGANNAAAGGAKTGAQGGANNAAAGGKQQQGGAAKQGQQQQKGKNGRRFNISRQN